MPQLETLLSLQFMELCVIRDDLLSEYQKNQALDKRDMRVCFFYTHAQHEPQVPTYLIVYKKLII